MLIFAGPDKIIAHYLDISHSQNNRCTFQPRKISWYHMSRTFSVQPSAYTFTTSPISITLFISDIFYQSQFLVLFLKVLVKKTSDHNSLSSCGASGTAVAQWLRCCATNRKVAGSIPDGVIGIFH